jgi:hypothetical protein
MIDALPSPKPLKNRYFLASTIGRDYKRNVLANGFPRGVSEQPLCASIPASDSAIQIFADDRIVRAIYDSS